MNHAFFHKFSFPSLRATSSIVPFFIFLQIVHCTLRDHSILVIIAASQLIQRCADVRKRTLTSGKRGTSPGSRGPLVPVGQPGLANRD